MSRKRLIILVVLAMAAIAALVWQFWGQVFWAVNGFQTLDKDQLELWEKRRDLVWPVVAATGLAAWGFVRFVWSKAVNDEQTASTQRAAELCYLKNLLREYELPQVEEAYTPQAADFQQNEHLPERRFFRANAISLLS